MTLKTLLSFSLVGVILVGGTLAILTAQTTRVENTFEVVDHATGIDEEVTIADNKIIKTARVMNETADPAYVRVRLEISPSSVAEDLTITPQLGNNWNDTLETTNGFYYYTEVLSGNTVGDDTYKTSDISFIITAPEGTEPFEVIIYSESCFASETNPSLEDIQERFNYISTGDVNTSEEYFEE